MKLHLHVKTVYFNQIKSGEKTTENRLVCSYWIKRFSGRQYDGVVIYNAYKPGADNRMEFPWRGFDLRTITHPHFGTRSVTVYAIHLIPTQSNP